MTNMPSNLGYNPSYTSLNPFKGLILVLIFRFYLFLQKKVCGNIWHIKEQWEIHNELSEMFLYKFEENIYINAILRINCPRICEVNFTLLQCLFCQAT